MGAVQYLATDAPKQDTFKAYVVWQFVNPDIIKKVTPGKLANIKSGVLRLLARQDASFTPRILACIEHICPVVRSTKYPGSGTGDPATLANAWLHYTQKLVGTLEGKTDPEEVKKLGNYAIADCCRAPDCALVRYIDLYFTFLHELNDPSGPSKRIWPWFAEAMNDPNPWPGVSLTAVRALLTALPALLQAPPPSHSDPNTKHGSRKKHERLELERLLQEYGEKCSSTPLWNAVVNYQKTASVLPYGLQGPRYGVAEGLFESIFTTAGTGFKGAFETFIASRMAGLPAATGRSVPAQPTGGDGGGGGGGGGGDARSYVHIAASRPVGMDDSVSNAVHALLSELNASSQMLQAGGNTLETRMQAVQLMTAVGTAMKCLLTVPLPDRPRAGLSLFGSGIFGAQQPAATGFGGGAGGLFGAAPAVSTAGGGMFGAAPAAGGGLFGAAPAAPAGGGLFGAHQPAATGFSGAAPAAGGLFGAQPAVGGLFGAAPAAGGLFGAQQPAAGGFGAAPPRFAVPDPTGDGGFGGASATAPTGLFD